MKAQSLRLDVAANDPEAERPYGWDAFDVWREQVRKATNETAAAPSQGWDPYLVWLTRVKKS